MACTAQELKLKRMDRSANLPSCPQQIPFRAVSAGPHGHGPAFAPSRVFSSQQQLLRGRSHRVAGGVRQSVNAGPNPNPREGAPEKNIKKNYKKSQPLPPAPSLPPSLPLNRPVVEQNPSRSRRRNTPRTPEPRESGERKDPVLFPPSCCAGW